MTLMETRAEPNGNAHKLRIFWTVSRLLHP